MIKTIKKIKAKIKQAEFEQKITKPINKFRVQNEEDFQYDILNGHKKDCPGYRDLYRGIDCNCFKDIEDYSI